MSENWRCLWCWWPCPCTCWCACWYWCACPSPCWSWSWCWCRCSCWCPSPSPCRFWCWCWCWCCNNRPPLPNSPHLLNKVLHGIQNHLSPLSPHVVRPHAPHLRDKRILNPLLPLHPQISLQRLLNRLVHLSLTISTIRYRVPIRIRPRSRHRIRKHDQTIPYSGVGVHIDYRLLHMYSRLPEL